MVGIEVGNTIHGLGPQKFVRGKRDDEEIEVDGNNFQKHIEIIVFRLWHLLDCVWTDDNSRKVPVMEVLEDKVWAAVPTWVGANEDWSVVTLSRYGLRGLLVAIEARVDTHIRAFFTNEQQCNALRSLINQAIWVSLGPIWKQEEPRKFLRR